MAPPPTAAAVAGAETEAEAGLEAPAEAQPPPLPLPLRAAVAVEVEDADGSYFSAFCEAADGASALHAQVVSLTAEARVDRAEVEVVTGGEPGG